MYINQKKIIINYSGEAAFHCLMTGFGWAKNPMLKRIDDLDPALAITVLYGSRSWVDNSTGSVLSESRPDSKTYVQVRKAAFFIYSV